MAFGGDSLDPFESLDSVPAVVPSGCQAGPGGAEEARLEP